MHIGVDVGTSSTKSCAFDEHGLLVAEANYAYDFSNLSEGKREIDPASFQTAVIETLKSVSQQLKEGHRPLPRSITISSLGEAVVPLDTDGIPLHPFISGTDIRGEKESHCLGTQVGFEAVAAITGVAVGGLFSVGKMMWIQQHLPHVYEKADKWLNVQDYVVYLLSGHMVMDESIASRTMLYDYIQHEWSQTLLDISGFAKRQLPDVVRSGTAVGCILPHIAAMTGLPSDTRIVVGSHDHIANALGCGVLKPGWACNPTGTTEGITAIMNERISPEHIAKFNISCEPFAISGLYCTVAWHNAAGALIKWYMREIAHHADGGLDGLNEKCPSHPTRLLILPHFSGGATPDFDSGSKGAVIGMTLSTTHYDIFKALMEGTCFELRKIMNTMTECGLSIHHLVMCGGGAHSPVWRQLKSDILDRPISLPSRQQTGALGCSIMGAVACGDYFDIPHAVTSMTDIQPAAQPIEQHVIEYASLMQAYQTLYPLLAPIHHVL